MSLEIGSIAPVFTAAANAGKTISLEEYKGSWVVLYFYPKDDTSGCTKEACGFRDNFERISGSNKAVVLGVSPDSPKSHDKFIGKYELNFDLISDESHDICNAYGVWVEKSMYGRKYMGVERTTFIINPKGEIAKIYNKVKVDGHIDAVIADLEKLQAE